MQCEIVEETSDGLLCEDVIRWRYAVQKRCWKPAKNGIFKIDEDARRDEIAKKAYSRWQHLGGDATENWLVAEAEVDAALFD